MYVEWPNTSVPIRKCKIEKKTRNTIKPLLMYNAYYALICCERTYHYYYDYACMYSICI